MGTNIKNLMHPEEIGLESLKNKILVVDSFNMMYQFLTTIRQRDGTLLKDSHGNITSVLVGLSSRIPNLIQKGIKLAFVFDGKAPELKKKERERRRAIKIEAQRKYEAAAEAEDYELMKRYASVTSRLTTDIIEDAKELLSAFGLPVIQAPAEGEAQAAYIIKKSKAFAVISQDYDSIVHGCPIVIRNLSISGKRKIAGTLAYKKVMPQIIELKEILQTNEITQDQLIVIAMLTGTDYNIGGIKGYGAKTSLRMVKKMGDDFEALFKEVKWDDFFDVSWKDVFNLIKNMPVTDNYELRWHDIQPDKIKKLLHDEHDFSDERVEKIISQITQRKKGQMGLGGFLR